jgi:signal transduction histidine kinase/CheY-like chemotaxis protein
VPDQASEVEVDPRPPLIRRLLSPPRSEPGRVLDTAVLTTMGVTTALLALAAIVKPGLAVRAVVAFGVVDLLGGFALVLARRGRVRLAGAIFVASVVLLAAGFTIQSGGIRSPALGAMVIMVMMAGLLVGERAAIGIAILATAIGFGLALAEWYGVLPAPTVQHTPFTLWIIQTVWLGVVIALSRLATRTVRAALRRAESDLAERRQAELRRNVVESQLRQAQKMDALGTLAGGIAHDLNNILAAIGGNVDLARGDLPADHPVREWLDEIGRAHGRARDLVKRVLLFARRQETERKPIALGPVVEEALKLLRATVPSMVEVRFECPPDLPPVLADVTQIHQVVLNLGANAAYALRERGGVFTIALAPVTVGSGEAVKASDLVPGTYVRLSATDTGTGMSHPVLERIFEPFFTTKGTAGTGLGLAVVHGIVRDHGGAIAVESEPGRGTRFELFFPVTTVPVASLPDGPPEPRGEGQQVVYVDDEEALVLLMTRTLERLGYRATGFTDPAAALQAIRTDPAAVDVLITDFAMPGMTGTELARAAAAVSPNLPIMLVSGYGLGEDSTDRKVSLAARLPKPIALDELARTLDRIVPRAAKRA